MTGCRYLSLNVEDEDVDGASEAGELSELASELERLETLENELSMAQRWVQGRLTDVMDRISEQFGEQDGRFYAELLAALANGARTTEAAARRVDASPEMVADALVRLEELDVVRRKRGTWRVA